MMGHKICLNGEIWLIIPKLSLLPLLIWSTVWVYLNATVAVKILLRNTIIMTKLTFYIKAATNKI